MVTSYLTAWNAAIEDARSETSPEETRPLLALHPFLAGAFPVLALFAASAQRVELGDVTWPLTLALGGSFIVHMLLAIVIPGRDRASLAATWSILCFWCYGLLAQLALLPRSIELPAIPQSFVAPILFVVWFGGMWYLRRSQEEEQQKAENERLTSFANVSLLAGVVAMAALSLWHRPDLLPSFGGTAAYAAASSDSEAGDARLPVNGNRIRPDIYYLVVHRYAGAKTLAANFGFDNSDFVKSLEKSGFVVPKESWATETDARRGLAAALNMIHPAKSTAGDLEVRRQLVANQVVRLFKSQGYRYYHLGSPPDGLREHPLADWNLRFSPCANEFTESLLRLTPLGAWFPTLSLHDRELAKFDRLAVIPREASILPKLVVAHFVVPGDTWCLDRDGTELSTAEAAQRGIQQNYVNHVLFTNERLRQAVKAILSQSKTTPLIVIQSDTLAPAADAAAIASSSSPEPTFTALWLPDRAGRANIPASLSPGNTFRFLFRQYFRGEMALLSEPPPAIQ